MEQTHSRSYLREYKGYHITALDKMVTSMPEEPRYLVEVLSGDVEQDNLPKGRIPAGILFVTSYEAGEGADPAALNKAIETAKEWIDAYMVDKHAATPEQVAQSEELEEPENPETPEIPIVDTRASQQLEEAPAATEEPSGNESPAAAKEGPSFPVLTGEPTNFFTQLSKAGQSDFTMRVMNINGRMTVGIFPGPQAKGVIPANFTKDPADLDATFFTEIIGNLSDQMKPLPVVEAKEMKKPASSAKPKPKPKPAQKAKQASKPKEKRAVSKPEKKTKPVSKAKPVAKEKTKAVVAKKAKPEKPQAPAVPTLF